MNVYDLCIIGAGMYGSAAARHATLYSSVRVCLIGPNEPTTEERDHREIYSSYYDEGRIMYGVHSDKSLSILANHTISRLNHIEKLSGQKFYNPLGHLLVVKNSKDVKHSSQTNPTADLVDATCILKYPFLDLNGHTFVRYDNNGAGHISARKYVSAQRQIAKIQGCDIIEDIVITVTDSVDGIHEIDTQTKGIINAKQILFCTGAFTSFLNFHPVNRLRITIHKETVAKLRVSKEEAERISSMPPINYINTIDKLPSTIRGAYILPPILYPDGKYYLKIGPSGNLDYPKLKTLQDVKEWYCAKGDPQLLDALPNVLYNIISNLSVEGETSDTCLTCSSPSGLPYIDKLTPTVTVAVVGNGKGACLSDEVGRIAAHLSLTGEWDSELPKELFQAILSDE